jgi:hypothetical protein
MDINFSGTSYDSPTQYKMIKDALYEGVVNVEFTKVSGELRTMPCTLHKDWMPAEAVKKTHQTRLLDYETISVWCVDKQSWRSFKTMNVISVKAVDHAN